MKFIKCLFRTFTAPKESQLAYEWRALGLNLGSSAPCIPTPGRVVTVAFTPFLTISPLISKLFNVIYFHHETYSTPLPTWRLSLNRCAVARLFLLAAMPIGLPSWLTNTKSCTSPQSQHAMRYTSPFGTVNPSLSVLWTYLAIVLASDPTKLH